MVNFHIWNACAAYSLFLTFYMMTCKNLHETQKELAFCVGVLEAMSSLLVSGSLICFLFYYVYISFYRILMFFLKCVTKDSK